MSQMVGADVAEMRELAVSFDNKAAALRTMESQLSGRIHSAPWHGSDVQYFQHNWNTRHRRTILNSATAIANAAQVLRANADQQEIASDATFSGRVPTVGELRQAETQRVQDAGGGGWGVAASAFGSAYLSVLKAEKFVGDRIKNAAQGYLIRQAALTSIERWREAGDTRWELAKRLTRVVRGVPKGSPFKAISDGFGRVLGPVGIVLSAADLAGDLGNDDYAGAAFSAGSLALGVVGTAAAFGLIAVPGLGAVAVAWTVASLAYEHRETLIKAGRWVADKVSAGVQAVGDGVKSAVGQAKQNLNDMKDAATGVINRLTNPLRSVFG